jgi:hypothetical protein
MKTITITQHGISLAALVVALGWLLTTATGAHAQCTYAAGNNAVYGNCASKTSVAVQASTAYVDASGTVPTGTKPDFCLTLYNIISGLTGSGAVIDARGLNTSNSTMSCTSKSTPWVQSSGFSTHPATILLPAAQITVSNTWIMPQFARIVGEGAGLTTLLAASGFAAEGDGDSVIAMIEMGSQSTTLVFCGSTTNPDCIGVGIQDLTLNLNGSTATVPYGIYNATAQEQSFVDNVVFNNVGGASSSATALEVATAALDSGVGAGASNSGPYSNLICNIASTAGSASTRCVDMRAHTRGIHGMTCNGNSTATTAIYLDSDSDSIEDVYINGFTNGIFVGSQGNAPSNVLFNIAGGSNLTNLVHICGPYTSPGCTAASTYTCPGGSVNVCDLTILNVQAAANTTIQDDITDTTLSNSTSDQTVGTYILGEQIGTTSTTPPQYSRFTTSPRVATWGTGHVAPTSTCVSNGSLYSNAAATAAGKILYACVQGNWTNIK